MFEYEDLSDEKRNILEDSADDARLTAILMSIHGIRQGIVSQEEGLRAIKNVAISMLVA